MSNVAPDNMDAFVRQTNKTAAYQGRRPRGLPLASQVALAARVTALEAGAVPNLVAFHAYGTGAQSKSGAASDSALTPLASVHLNHGSAYSTSTGRFTCPVGGAGIYEFRFDTVQSTAVAGPEFRIYKNGLQYKFLAGIGYASFHQFGSTFIMDLIAGDYVQLYWSNNNATSVTIDLGRTNWSGKRIG